MTALIKLENVTKHYGTFQALSKINLDVKEGEVVCVIGPSGSGKSTLIRCINLLEEYDLSGKIIVDQILVQKGKNLKNVRAQVGMVFQSFNLFPHLTILKNVMLAPIKAKGLSAQVAEKIAVDLLNKVGILEQAEKYPAQLSGGQQQRVAIARALAMEPKALLFDEPTSALDPIATVNIEELMSGLKEKLSILIVTHNMQQAARISDYTAYMYLGELIEHDATDKIFTTPTMKETEDYITGKFG